MCKAIDSPNLQICEQALLTQANIASGSIEQKQIIIDANLIPKFVEFLTSTESNVCTAAARVLSNICHGKDGQIQAVVDASAIPYLINLLDGNAEHDSLKLQTPFIALINIAKGTREQKQSLIDANMMPHIYNFLNSSNILISQLAISFLVNITLIEPPQLLTIESSVLSQLSNFLISGNADICTAIAMLMRNLVGTNMEQKQHISDSCIIDSLIECLRKYSTEILKSDETSDIDEIFNAGKSKTVYSNAEDFKIPNYDICYFLITALQHLSFTELQPIFLQPNVIIFITKFLKPKFESICEKAVSLLAGLTMTKEGKNLIAKHSVLQMIRLLKLPKYQIPILLALLNISAAETDERELIIQAGAIPILIDLIKTKNGLKDGELETAILPVLDTLDLNICANAIGILRNISVDIPNGANEVIKYVPYFVKLLDHPNTEIQNVSASTLSNLCKALPQHREEVFKAGAIKPLIALFSNMATFENAAYAIESLTHDLDGIKAVIESGAIESLIAALDSPANLSYITAVILNNIANGGEDEKQAMIDAGVVSTIIKCFDYSNQNLCMPLWSTLHNIINGNDEQRNLVVESGVIPCLIELLKFEDMAPLVLNSLLKIAAGTNEEREKLIAAGVLEYLVKYLTSTNEKCLDYAAVSISVCTEKNIDDVIKIGAIPEFIKLLTSQYLNVRKAAAYAIANMTEGNVEQKDAILDAIPSLIKLLEGYDMQLCEQAARALKNLIQGTNNQLGKVIQEGAVPHIARILIVENKNAARHGEEALKYVLTTNNTFDDATMILERHKNHF